MIGKGEVEAGSVTSEEIEGDLEVVLKKGRGRNYVNVLDPEVETGIVIKSVQKRSPRKLNYENKLNQFVFLIFHDYLICRPIKNDVKVDESKKEEDEEEVKGTVKKEPLSLEELLAKKKAEEAEKSKVK